MKAALAIALILAADAARAADAPSPAPPAAPPENLSGVDVAVPRDAPTVASTYPAQGASVAPGILVVKIDFDQRMPRDAAASSITSRPSLHDEASHTTGSLPASVAVVRAATTRSVISA